MEEYDYDAAAGTIIIKDITTGRINSEILRQLKENDPGFDELWVGNGGDERCDNEYYPKFKSANDMGWIGYFIGENTTLKEITLCSDPFLGLPFYRGMNSNRSIQKISFHDINTGLRREIFEYLRPFFANNSNLSELEVERCQFGPGCAQQIALALRGCSKSLKCIKFGGNQMVVGKQSVKIIEALGMHPQLEKLEFKGMNIGSAAFANLLRGTFSELEELNLYATIPLMTKGWMLWWVLFQAIAF